MLDSSWKTFKVYKLSVILQRPNKNGNFLLLPYGDEIVKVPGKIGHGYIPLKILPLDELRTKYSRHKRLKTFHVKGLKCVSCPREGKYLIAAKDSTGAIHIDVYTEDRKSVV